MATKEMIIVFVYDTQLIQNEEDDPASAILYFHPTWVSDQQKTALCGQLMGVFHCLKGILKRPKIIALQSGKFFIREYGRYLLATGTDRNVVDWLLEHRANILHSLISFYHKGIEDLAVLYQTPQNLSAKLYHMFETYLKVLFLGGNSFTYMPILKLPKSANNVFLEAIHILQCCQKNKNVLGGTLLYHNKIVATQLNSDYTKRIVLTDPYRIKAPAEVVSADFDLPLGVQLLEVYIDKEEYYRLLEESTRSRSIFQYLNDKSITKVMKPASANKEPVISAMKRDQSLLFTAVLEEDADHSSTAKEPIVPMRNVNRPKFLNLKNKTTDINTESMESVKSVAGTPHLGQTSVCSTPLTDLNKVIHATPLSICGNFVPVQKHENEEENEKTVNEVSTETNSNICTLEDKDYTSLHSTDLTKIAPFLKVANSIYDNKKCYSMSNLCVKEDNEDGCLNLQSNSKTKDTTEDTSPKPEIERYKTIADPLFPIFKYNGLPASYSYYKEAIAKQTELMANGINSLSQQDVDEIPNTIHQTKDVVKENGVRLRKRKDIPNNVIHNKESVDVESEKIDSKEKRKSLTLPLKSLSLDGPSIDQPSPITRRYSVGVQLTPLMSKLSALDFEEKSSGFGSRQTTPGDYSGAFTPGHNFPLALKYKTMENKQTKKHYKLDMQKCVMFVFGQQDTVAVILLQEDISGSSDVISALFDICSEYLGKLEKQLCHCLETYPNGNVQNEAEPYSYLCLDPDWDTLQRGGPWTATELGALTNMHRDFIENSNIVEILTRGSENVVYGYHLGDTEVYYHQAAASNAGLPTPADTMGNVPLKARRRLERDHGVILL